jgi:hypothetical protein
MIYVKAYLLAFFAIAKVHGFILLVLAPFFGVGLALPLLYLSVVAAVGGPIGQLMADRVNAK